MIAEMKDYEEFKIYKNLYSILVDQWSKELNSFPVQANGLVSNEIRNTKEYIAVDGMFKQCFKDYQHFNLLNKKYLKRYAKEQRQAKISKKA